MLVSNRKKFIFTKTKKTAGTSVESFFEPYCMNDKEFVEKDSRQEYISSTGIVGHRGGIGAKKPKWYNHMPAKLICKQLGQEIWNEYFKFTVVRNPFDKLISGFAMVDNQVKKDPKFFGAKNLIHRVVGATDIERFRSWLKLGGGKKFIDRDAYLIDGEVCMDYFIKYEDLDGGISYVSEHLGLESQDRKLPKFKSGIRKDKDKISEYYDEETEEIVRSLFSWELDYFGYKMPK